VSAKGAKKKIGHRGKDKKIRMPHPTSLPTAPRREEEQKDERKRIHHEDKKSTKKGAENAED